MAGSSGGLIKKVCSHLVGRVVGPLRWIWGAPLGTGCSLGATYGNPGICRSGPHIFVVLVVVVVPCMWGIFVGNLCVGSPCRLLSGS